MDPTKPQLEHKKSEPAKLDFHASNESTMDTLKSKLVRGARRGVAWRDVAWRTVGFVHLFTLHFPALPTLHARRVVNCPLPSHTHTRTRTHTHTPFPVPHTLTHSCFRRYLFPVSHDPYLARVWGLVLDGCASAPREEDRVGGGLKSTTSCRYVEFSFPLTYGFIFKVKKKKRMAHKAGVHLRN